MRTLSHRQARVFYDRFGARQDRQAYYEDAATAVLLAHGAFDRATAVVELGCGTGRFAETLLAEHLPPGATYYGADISSTMVELAGRRLERFGSRARVVRTHGSPQLELASASCDRFVSNYLFDLLAVEEIEAAIGEAERLLCSGGRLCLSGLTEGCSPLSRLVAGAWKLVHAVRPSLVGGCRPVELGAFLAAGAWEVKVDERLVARGIASQAVVAIKAPSAPAPAR